MTGKRILVVDDEPSIVDAVSTALRYEGYEVTEASTGREALEAVAIGKFMLNPRRVLSKVQILPGRPLRLPRARREPVRSVA